MINFSKKQKQNGRALLQADSKKQTNTFHKHIEQQRRVENEEDRTLLVYFAYINTFCLEIPPWCISPEASMIL